MIRSVVKSAVLGGLKHLGINAIERARRAKDLLVVTYHGVLPTDNAADRFGYENTVSAGEFDGHLRFLKRRFHPLSLADLLSCVRGERELPPRPALVTFDDGYRNNLTHAAPLLAKHGVPAIVFLSTAYIGERRILWPTELVERLLVWPLPTIALPGGEAEEPMPSALEGRRALAKRIVRDAKRRPARESAEYLEFVRSHTRLDPGLAEQDLYAFLTWDEVRTLSRMGVELGAHSVHHSILSRLSPEDLRDELRESKARIEHELGSECFSMAYPNGTSLDYSPEVIEAVRRSGYSLAFAVTNDFHRPGGDPFAVGRMVVPGHLPQVAFEAQASGTLLTLNHLLGRHPGAAGA